MLLIVGAFPPETSDLENLAGGSVRVASTGIGPVDSLLGLEQLTREHNPDELLFLGSVGAYGPSRLSNQFVYCRDFLFLEPAALRNQAKMVPAMRLIARSAPGPLGESMVASEEFDRVWSNTTAGLSLVQQEFIPERLAEIVPSMKEHSAPGWEQWPVVESLELFALARFCELHKIPFLSLLAVTNEVGPSGSEQWAQNHEALGKELQQKVRSILEK
ncbi:MAG: hypothetical protein KDK33_10280 [Leptospiraceae bacterium]|nr:hypothetical protein [Leptospiraceae bacterium]